MQDHIPPEWTGAVPPMLGAAVSAASSKEQKLRAAFLFGIASGLGFVMQTPTAEMLHIPPVLTGVFIGAFGIPVINKGLEVLQTLPLAQYAQEWIQSKLPPKV